MTWRQYSALVLSASATAEGSLADHDCFWSDEQWRCEICWILALKNKVCDDLGYRAFENCNMIENLLLNQALCGNNRNLRPWQLRQFLRLYFAGPLQQAHGQDPQCLHPISLHLMASDVIPPLEAKSNWWYVTAQKFWKHLTTPWHCRCICGRVVGCCGAGSRSEWGLGRGDGAERIQRIGNIGSIW